jgi:GNAT superfamily N-acetyltransferase
MPTDHFEIREPVLEDIASLRPIFDYWIKDENGEELPDEVVADLASVEASIAGNTSQRFLVAANAGKVVGVMGIQPPESVMLEYTTTLNPAELITALVSNDSRRHGVGKALVSAISEKAVDEGATELVVSSSSRYEEYGWPFWEGQFGEPVAEGHNISESDRYTKVWCKSMVEDQPDADVAPATAPPPREPGESRDDYETRIRFTRKIAPDRVL